MSRDRPLGHVERAAGRAATARDGLHESIRLAHRNGHSLRAIAAAASLSHEQVRRIVSRADLDLR